MNLKEVERISRMAEEVKLAMPELQLTLEDASYIEEYSKGRIFSAIWTGYKVGLMRGLKLCKEGENERG